MENYGVVNRKPIGVVGSNEYTMLHVLGQGLDVLEIKTPHYENYTLPKRWYRPRPKDIKIKVLESVKYYL